MDFEKGVEDRNCHRQSLFSVLSFDAIIFDDETWMANRYKALSSLVDGHEGSYLPKCQTNILIYLHELSPLLWYFIKKASYNLGRFEPSSPYTKELHGQVVGNPGLTNRCRKRLMIERL